MRVRTLIVVLVTLILVLPLRSAAQEPMIIFDGCSILDSGTPWKDHVMYVFSGEAGADPVNDIHICVYDRDGMPLEVVGVSSPGSWEGHFPPGGNCVEYWTDENPIPPGTTYGPFDFIVPPGHCLIIVEWVFTLDGVALTDWQIVTWSCIYTSSDNESWSEIKALSR